VPRHAEMDESWADAYESDDSLPPIPPEWLEDAKAAKEEEWTVVETKKKPRRYRR